MVYLYNYCTKELLSNIEDVVKNFKTEKFLQLTVDEPSVNWSVLSVLDNKLEESNLKKRLTLEEVAANTLFRVH